MKHPTTIVFCCFLLLFSLYANLQRVLAAELIVEPNTPDLSTQLAVPEDDEYEVIPTDPGMALTPVSKNTSRPALSQGSTVTNILWNIFPSFQRIIATLISIGQCGSADEACLDVNDLSLMTKQAQYMYGRGGPNSGGGPMLSKFHGDKFEWPDKPEDELRFQYPGCFQTIKNPAAAITNQIIEKVVNSNLAISKNKQKDLSYGPVYTYLGAALTGAFKPLDKFKFSTPKYEIFENINGTYKLKKEYEAMFAECERQSKAKSVQSRPEPVIGSIDGGPAIQVSATTQELIDLVGGVGKCVADFQSCLAKIIPSALSGGIWTVNPGIPTTMGFGGGGIDESELPPIVSAETKSLLKTIRPGGWWGSNLPRGLYKRLDSYSKSTGEVYTKVNVQAEASPLESIADTVNLKYDATKGIERRWMLADVCSPLPLGSKEGQNARGITNECRPSEDEAVSGWTYDDLPSDGSVPGPIASGEFQNLLLQAANTIGIPACVLEGVARIERRPNMPDEPDISKCLASVNTCSAAGPMQFTTGKGPASDPLCRTCAAGFCPNAWISYGNGGNPCVSADALAAAARYLQKAGKLTSAPATSQKSAIHKAATAYYGSDNDSLARNRLNGCEYWEFVYQQCDPSFRCAQQRN